ncbi:MAG: hypothetical protein LBC49_03260 [Bacteroidales bacterium]|jgi:hypothetical protein|nr:hypothetical protein [Bacteroidales bacterium]
MPRLQAIIQGNAATLLILLFVGISDAQVIVYEDYVPEKKFIYKKEWAVKIFLHTGGIGAGFEQGWFDKKSRYSGYNIDILTQWNPKRFKYQSPYGGRSYVYGMLAEFGMMRGGYGTAVTLHEKPFWGGVEVSMFVNGGFSLGFRFPQYLLVTTREQEPDPPYDYIIYAEKYDPDAEHFQKGEIIARDKIFSSWKGLQLYPGMYAKTGVSFEFGKIETRTHTLEVGVSYDFYFRGVPLYAKTRAPWGFFNLFLSYRFGMRSGIR